MLADRSDKETQYCNECPEQELMIRFKCSDDIIQDLKDCIEENKKQKSTQEVNDFKFCTEALADCQKGEQKRHCSDNRS